MEKNLDRLLSWRLAVARKEVMATMLKGWCRSFPVRLLRHGEAAFYDDDGKRVFLEKEAEWSASEPDMLSRFDSMVRDSVGRAALVFRLSPQTIMPTAVADLPKLPLVYLNGYVLARRHARQMGRSFNREMRCGPRRWW